MARIFSSNRHAHSLMPFALYTSIVFLPLMLKLTVNQRILVHLLGFSSSAAKEPYPLEATQKGIASGIGARLNHIPRAVARMEKEELLVARRGHVIGQSRRLKCYVLTQQGMSQARGLRKSLAAQTISVIGPEDPKEMTMAEARDEMETKLSLLELYIQTGDDGVLDLTPGASKKKKKEKGAGANASKSKDIHFIPDKSPDKTTDRPSDKARSRKGSLDSSKRKEPARKSKNVVHGTIPITINFIGRDRDFMTLQSWLERNGAGTMTIIGPLGIGKSALAAEIARRVKDRPVFWYSLKNGKDLPGLAKEMERFISLLKLQKDKKDEEKKKKKKKKENDDDNDLSKSGSNLLDRLVLALDGLDALLVVDDYFEAEEELATFVEALVHRAGSMNLHMLVSMRDTTPFYSRFYRREELEHGLVVELALKGLEPKFMPSLLQTSELEEDALRKIHLMTRGHPLSLVLLRNCEDVKLKGLKGFTQEEVNLLKFLAGVKEGNL